MTILNRLVVNDLRLTYGRQFIDSVTSDNYYVYIGNHIANTTHLERTLYNNANDSFFDCYRNMIAGVRVGSNDVTLGIRNIPWETNTVYDVYDDAEVELASRSFYCVVNAGSYSHVFKCLDNAGNTSSTVEPDFAQIDSTDKVYSTSDGYVWKYMYSATSNEVIRFASEDYFPVFSNTTVQSHAVPGSIDSYIIENSGAGYDNYLTGTFTSSDLRLGGNTILYNLSSASTQNNFYTDCYLYISAGTGTGQYRRITGYVVNSTYSAVTLETEFTTNPTNGSEYEIYPAVNVYGNDKQTTNAAARALVNSVTNTIYSIEVLEVGANYQIARANVASATEVGVTTQAEVRPILAPKLGHGSDPASELYSNAVLIAVDFATTLSNNFIGGQFASIGMVRNPLFANVSLTVDSANGTFNDGTTTVFLSSNHYVTIANSTIDANNFLFGDTSVVRKITANTWLYADTSDFGNTAVITNQTGNTVLVTNATGSIVPGQKLWSATSNAYANILTVSISGESKNMNEFLQMYRYTGAMTSGTFTNGEILTQGSTTAYLHSCNSTVFFITNASNTLSLNTTVTGNTSGATATFTAVKPPELVYGTGDVVYVENFDVIARDPEQTEQFNIVLTF